jgi:hypothetical protein
LSRYALLRHLHRQGINPFNVYRADDEPRPKRFPVFVRQERGHKILAEDLIGTQSELERRLSKLAAEGEPLRSLLVVEYCGEEILPGVWRKFGTFRIGEQCFVHRQTTESSWIVKVGKKGSWPDWLHSVENEMVLQNRVPSAVSSAFEMSGIEYGRADHGRVDGVDVVYEINTNPVIPVPPKNAPALRQAALAHGRASMAAALWEIDSGNGEAVGFDRPLDVAKLTRRSGLRELLARAFRRSLRRP